MPDRYMLDDINRLFPDNWEPDRLASAQTAFFKQLALLIHQHYGGKIQIMPRTGLWGLNWFNVYYTPGVSAVSTAIRDNNQLSYNLSWRGNCVAVVSDSTRVLGDGDVTPSGGMGVMEGKALLMKYLGGVDAVPLCIDSRDENGNPNADNIIDFVLRAAPSFGAVNLEDISQPNCYRVLSELQKRCPIPVWHDDAQGTASVTLAGLYNALHLAGKEIDQVKCVFMGAGAAGSAIVRLCLAAGVNPANCVVFDQYGSLHKDRKDYFEHSYWQGQQQICLTTNPGKIETLEQALTGADVLIAVSKPGPGTITPVHIKLMGPKPIVFACANPVPEIYPHQALEAGAFIVATGRGDFANQVNNSLGFPSILKGTLLVRAKSITDTMAIAAAKAIAKFAKDRGINSQNIIPTMAEHELVPLVAATVATQAVADGVATIKMDFDTAYAQAKADLNATHNTVKHLQQKIIGNPPAHLVQAALKQVIAEFEPQQV